MNPEIRLKWLTEPTERLLAECRQDFFIATGNGGQHRNKTESAVRLIHPPSGMTVTATGSRHREENRTDALRKLRMAIALNCRLADDEPPALPEPSVRHPLWALFAARLLDKLLLHHGAVSETAADCGCSTGQLIRILAKDPILWQTVNQLREKNGLIPLK